MKAILFASLLLAACAAEGTPPVPAVSSSALERDDNEEQGRYLLGRYADAKATGGWHFWVSNIGVVGSETVEVSVSGDRLVATHADGTPFSDAEFATMTFNTGTHPLKIDAVTVSATGEVTYRLSYNDGSGWTDYCDSTLSTEAIPMRGRWSNARDHMDGAELSFACVRGGVAAKCIEWDYSPGTGGRLDADWQLHQTCTQHASAVYCNNGLARTRELTPIAIRDWVDERKPAPDDDPALPTLDPALTWPPPDEFYMEGVWEFDRPVRCLSKLRWAALPPGGYCPIAVPDPRTSEGYAMGGRFCDELSFADLEASGASFVTASLVMDIYAHAWINTSGDRLTTVAGYVENGVAVSVPYPGEGYQLAGPSFILLRNLPGSLDSIADVTPVYAQHNKTTGDRVVAPIDPSTGKGITPGHTVDMSRPEGYLLKHPSPSLVQLMLFRNGSDFVTALTNPGGYTFVRNLGYVTSP